MYRKFTIAALAGLMTISAVVPEVAMAQRYENGRHYDRHNNRHNDRYYRGNARYRGERRCSGGNGAVGTVAGGVGGALIGNAVGGGTLGTIGGGIGGALLGRTLDKNNTRHRRGC